MGRIDQKIIDSFNGGMIADPRTKDFRYAQVIKNFDAHTYPHKLVPFRDSVSGDDFAATSQKQNFTIALRQDTTYSLYALGVVSGTTRAEVLYKNLTQDSTNDMSDGGWVAPSANQQPASTGNTNFNLFVYYRNQNLIYGARNGSHIWAFSPSGTAWANTHQALTYTSIGQGLVFTNDILYIPYYNSAGAAGAKSFIASNNAGTWNNTALTLPDDQVPVSICAYGNFLAIGTQHVSATNANGGVGVSKVYLWDTTSASWSDVIDWGEGNLQILEQIEGHLIGISYGAISTTQFFGKVIVREYAGGSVNVIKQFIGDGNNVVLPTFKQKVNNYLYFPFGISLNSVVQVGIWKIGRLTPNDPFSMVLDRTLSNDTVITSYTLSGFFFVGDYLFISFQNGTTWNLSKTRSTASFTASGTYESLIIDGGKPHQKKKLISAGVMIDPLNLGQIILAYKVDADTTWTTIFTRTYVAADRGYHEAINIETSGANLPQFRELQLRVLSTLNVTVTAIKAKWEEIPDSLTD